MHKGPFNFICVRNIIRCLGTNIKVCEKAEPIMTATTMAQTCGWPSLSLSQSWYPTTTATRSFSLNYTESSSMTMTTMQWQCPSSADGHHHLGTAHIHYLHLNRMTVRSLTACSNTYTNGIPLHEAEDEFMTLWLHPPAMCSHITHWHLPRLSLWHTVALCNGYSVIYNLIYLIRLSPYFASLNWWFCEVHRLRARKPNK